MRVLVLTDASFAEREHLLLTRLEIGLAGDGTAVIHAVPSSCPSDIAAAFSSTVVRYDDTPTPFGRGPRVRQIMNAAKEQLDLPEVKIDVVHAFGQSVWGLAHALARQAGAALVLEVWRADLVGAAARCAKRFASESARGGGAGGGIGGGVGGTGRWGGAGLLTSSARIEQDLRAELRGGAGGACVSGAAPWGVPMSDNVRPPIQPGAAVAISVLGSGRDTAAMRALLDGIRRVGSRRENVLVFLDGVAADRPAVWRAARRLGLLDRLTSVADMEGRREPILQTDILVVAEPPPWGVCRTLPLAAMADGVAVVARADPYHAEWLNETTARLVGGAGNAGRPATPEEWDAAISACIDDPARTASLRAAARSLVRQQRTVIAHVEGVRRLYDQVVVKELKPATTAFAATARE